MPGLALALEDPGDVAGIEPWVRPEQLQQVGDGSVDLSSVCAVTTELLYVMSGRQFGVREKTIRPNQGDPNHCYSTSTELVLPGPVREVIEVRLNGDVLVKDTDYRVLDRRRLVRLPVDGLLYGWPTNQRLDLDDDQQDTFSVEFRWGKDVPQGGRAAAAYFARHLALYFQKDRKGSGCALTDKQVSVSRQGVSRTYMDPADLIRERKTGLYLVDQWLSTVNPSGSSRKPRVFGPDNVRKSRVT